MFKKLLVLSVLLQSTYSIAEETKKPKYLHWKLNEHVIVTISNIACPFPQMRDEYPYASVASRVDGQKLAGCFKELDANNIEIFWYQGDKSVIPANAFLQKPIDIIKQPESTM